jgi:hypothetical protein
MVMPNSMFDSCTINRMSQSLPLMLNIPGGDAVTLIWIRDPLGDAAERETDAA